MSTMRAEDIVYRCPHCAELLGDRPAAAAVRCPSCRLVVGAGRALRDGRQNGVSAGTSAGIKASAARRAGLEPVDRDLVTAAINTAIDEIGGPPLRLRMVDYDVRATRRPADFPGLAEVLATFGSWKAARAAAVREREQADR